MYDPEAHFIVVTGGPCAGKSTMLAQAQAQLEDFGIQVFVLKETATELIEAGFSPTANPIAFQYFVFDWSYSKELRFYNSARMQYPEGPLVLLCDRGLLDGAAYVDEALFQQLLEDSNCTRDQLLMRYSMVIHLVTAADGAEEFYTLENNRARMETPEEARVLDKRTQAAWTGHPHRFVVDNSTGFDEKVRRAINAMRRVLKMPEQMEIERKFIIRNFTPALIPQGAVEVDIEQTYLTDLPNGTARRVRKRTHDGHSTYTYTEKEVTPAKGEFLERERIITVREYLDLLKDADPDSMVVKKRRHHFLYNNLSFEVDRYIEPPSAAPLRILEIELEHMQVPVSFPPGWEVEEVTGVKRYANREIARGSLSRIDFFV